MQKFEKQPGTGARLTDKVQLHQTSLLKLEEVTVLSKVKRPTERVEKNENRREYSKQKNKKSLKRNHNEMEINGLSDL